MSIRDARQIVDGKIPDCSRSEIQDAWQLLVDTGAVWNLTEWHSKMASCQIEAGTLERNAA